MLRFLAGRATAGVECALGEGYLRTIALSDRRGWVKVSPVPDRPALAVELSTSLAAVLPALLPCLRCLFDLDARPDVIEAQLGMDSRLAEAIERLPGLRVPGCADGFELAIRAILGQRISVVGANALAGRLAMALGEPIETPFPTLVRLSPTPETLASAEPGQLVSLGIAAPRAVAIIEPREPSSKDGFNSSLASTPSRRLAASRSFPESASGPRITSPCVPSAGPMPFRPPIWDYFGPRVGALREPWSKLRLALASLAIVCGHALVE